MTDAAVAEAALRRFAGHFSRGEARAALRAASDACHAAPGLREPHYAYGQAWLALDQPARAEQAFAAALRIAPGWADAWVNLGIARYRQGAVADAKLAMRQALRHAPGHPAATANLGAFLRITGEAEDSEALLRDSLAMAPDNVGARLNLVADLLQDGRSADALALLGAAAAPPGDPAALRHWHLQRALALLHLNRPADARAALDAIAALGAIPPEIAPLWHWRAVLLAQSGDDLDAARQAAERMAAALEAMGPSGVAEHRIMGHYDLARFWSGQDDDRAFAHWGAGHALLRRMQPFSREAHRAFIDANMALLGRDRLAGGARAGNADPAPVFIVGMPRSGTTLCEQILAAHRQAHGAGERPALTRAFAALGGGGHPSAQAVRRIAGLERPALDAAAAHYLAELHALAPAASRIIDKMPGNYLHLGLVALLLPGARIIHCVRDPRDIGLSIWTYRFHGEHGYAHDLADLGWTIGQQHRLMAHWRQAMPNPILTVALSDWVADFDATLARVLAHLDLPADPNCARFHEQDNRVRTVSRAQVRQRVNARGLGRWRPHATRLAPLIEELERAGLIEGGAG